ncbi:hypothetical protein AZI85_02935 [Bdellovibrio bacteriovorus]|uniref:DUF3943 domain-containing protein n=1 Tax=Bdellovibrio bacteriovorus TaxID=959 RepID=A0A150WKY1_BDEBC|nr:DUF3943 domain-containing protein [Bdellovibrio bacteriovorus]KYG64393.1 hypothetical protein AZI85_02935 [Bdellovibrio bacteriovorus]
MGIRKWNWMLLAFFSLCFVGLEAQAYQVPKKILVSVGDLKENHKLSWRKETCALIHTLANQISDVAVNVTCRSFDVSNFADKELIELRRHHNYHLRLTRTREGEVKMDVSNWSRNFETDFENLQWKFKASPTDNTQNEAIAKAASNFFIYAANEKTFRAGLLVNGAAESNEIIYDQKKGLFLDKYTNEPLTIDQAYARFEKESPRKKNYLRTGIEIGVMLSAALGIYYKNLAYNRQDFDYALGEGIRKKLTGEAILFDDNDKFANVGHIFAGVLYYQTARANGFNSLESFLVSFASSAAWEFLEYHEVFSLNDQIMTPIGGYVIGEASYQISCALLAKGTTAGKVLAYSINPGLGLNHAIDKIQTGDKYASQPDCKKPRWSDISVYVGLEKNQKPFKPTAENTYVLGMSADVVNIENYAKPGHEAKMVYDTAMVKALLENNGGDGMGDLKLIAQVTMAAYYKKNVEQDAHGQLRGYDLILGVGSGTTFHDRGGDKQSGHEDFYGTINILGATARANIYYKGMNIQAEFGFYGDFAMVKSWALNDFEARNGGSLAGQPSVVQKRGYYWGLGTTTLAALSAEQGRFKVGYELQSSRASDIQSRHRNQSDVQDPADFQDSYMSHRIYVRFRLTKNLSFQLSREAIVRAGSANGQATAKGKETRTMGTLVYLF